MNKIGNETSEYNENIFKISDNIDTADNKSIAVFSPNPDIAKNLSRLNKAIVIKPNVLDIFKLPDELSEIRILASFNLIENDSVDIYCNDKLFSDFMFAFMRMHGVSAYCNPFGNQLKLEGAGKKLISIDIPSSQKNNLGTIIDGMASFLNEGLYLFNNRLYVSKKEWERDIRLVLSSKLSNIKGMFRTITPEGVNSVVNSTLAKVDPRHTNDVLSVTKGVVDEVLGKLNKEKAEVDAKKAELKGLRKKVKLKRKAKAKLVKQIRVRKKYKAATKQSLRSKLRTKPMKQKKIRKSYKAARRRLKSMVKAPIRVKKKKVKKYYKIKKPASEVITKIPKAAETKPMLAESILEPKLQNTGFHRLKSKLNRYEPVHKRKRLGARILERREI